MRNLLYLYNLNHKNKYGQVNSYNLPDNIFHQHLPMKTIEIKTLLRECRYSQLPEADRKLVDAAKEATKSSYAPYSKFQVGAAILLADGTVVTGSNQENAAFSSGTCAERSACFAAGANHKDVPMLKIAIAAWTAGAFQFMPISPCGACRQALLEYEVKQGTPIEVILYGSEKVYMLESIAALLPLCFAEF